MLCIEDNDNISVIDSKTIIKTIFEIYPHIVYLNNLLMFEKYQYCNDAIVEYLSLNPLFDNIFEKNFIEVYENTSFDYEYGSICSTHICYAHVGYTYRTKETEELSISE